MEALNCSMMEVRAHFSMKTRKCSLSLNVLIMHIYFSLKNILRWTHEVKHLWKILSPFACFSVWPFFCLSLYPIARLFGWTFLYLFDCQFVRVSSGPTHGFSDSLHKFTVPSNLKTSNAWVLENKKTRFGDFGSEMKLRKMKFFKFYDKSARGIFLISAVNYSDIYL